MRRTTPILASVAASIAIAALTAGPALADRGAPGTTFPEQPGTHLQTGCAAVLASAAPGSGDPGEGKPHATRAKRRESIERVDLEDAKAPRGGWRRVGDAWSPAQHHDPRRARGRSLRRLRKKPGNRGESTGSRARRALPAGYWAGDVGGER
jgi:hypothetical protein